MKKDMIGKGFHILTKPIGPICNLNCKYCFYTEKKALYPEKKDFRMSDEVLEAFIHKYISSQQIPEIQFVWQGGEPTLMNLDFFHKVISLQKKYADGKKIINSLQTNGTLIDDKWCKFLKENDFLVGLSLDGPAELHDLYRIYVNGNPTLNKVINTLYLLKEYEIPYNVLLCVTKESSKYPIKVYNFLKKLGVEYIQFTPVVERIPDDMSAQIGLKHASPASKNDENQQKLVTDFSVEAGSYGNFLIKIFDEWIQKDVGSIYVMNFEWALEAWMGLPSTICIFSKQCGRALAIEHNGDIYSCDHYVYPEYYLGNILVSNPKEMVEMNKQKAFGQNKESSLPEVCRECEVKFACNGECPRHRFVRTYDNKPGLSYLCQDYKKFFRHIHKYMKVMVQLIENNLPASKVMDVIKGPLVITKK
ncbi:anaerobic sulfatase maturase [Clostridium sp. PL3]|uniref:Anaerobic sulfatase maturase n=1 Tax=Clostridium thailandense TaxID=2794346 RepID=A0A949U131_9CLOT|nr:anaerobic sulfatase maturase [Clostridium thailandense]MBV7274334.1 anaerobic sulfatase maturase [Clostridium thailandense]